MAELNRGTGLLVIEVQHSNPNGDPDGESEPRTLDIDGRGLISPVSFKRKLRDIVSEKEGSVWHGASEALHLATNGSGRRFDILESRGRKRDEISRMNREAFTNAFWDGRVFGNTFLEKEGAADEKEHFISTGVVQFGPGVSVAPIEVERLTLTNKSGVEEGKDRGMAPLAWRVVRHAVYVMPFFVNPFVARKTGCDKKDVDLLKFAIPHAYRCTASAMRPNVGVLHAWYAEHKDPLGSCPDSLILSALTPKKKDKAEEASRSLDDYEMPTKLPDNVRSRLASFEDLCAKAW